MASLNMLRNIQISFLLTPRKLKVDFINKMRKYKFKII